MNSYEYQKYGFTLIQERNPRIINVPGVGNVNVKYGEKIQDIFEAIYEKGFKEGIENGKKIKSEEIQKVLKEKLHETN